MSKVNSLLKDVRKQLTFLESEICHSGELKESISLWSVGHHIEHLLKADNWMANEILSNKPNPESAKPLSFIGRVVLFTGFIPKGKGKAPERTLPEQPTEENLTSQAKALREGLQKIEEKASSLDLNGRFSPHPIFGKMTHMQWLQFMKIHNHHHIKIIRDIL